MLQRPALAPLLAAALSVLLLAAPGAAHPGHFASEAFAGGLPHPFHHFAALGPLLVATTAGVIAWDLARRRHSAVPVLRAASAALFAAGAWLLVV